MDSQILGLHQQDQDRIGAFRNLDDIIYGDDKVNKYIRGKFNEEINLDKSYKKIYDNLYVGNYIGIKDDTNMFNFNNMNLYESYFTVFPNLTSDVSALYYFVIFAQLQ